MKFRTGQSVWRLRCQLLGVDENKAASEYPDFNPSEYCDFGSRWLQALASSPEVECVRSLPLAVRALHLLDNLNFVCVKWRNASEMEEKKDVGTRHNASTLWGFVQRLEWMSDEVKYLSSSLDVWSVPGVVLTHKSAWYAVCMKGELDLAKWMALHFRDYLTDFPCSPKLFYEVVKHNHLDVARWMMSLLCPTSKKKLMQDFVMPVSFEADVESVNWIISQFPSPSECKGEGDGGLYNFLTMYFLPWAVQKGRIDCLEHGIKLMKHMSAEKIDLNQALLKANGKVNLQVTQWVQTQLERYPEVFHGLSSSDKLDCMLLGLRKGYFEVAQNWKTKFPEDCRPTNIDWHAFQDVMTRGKVEELDWWLQEVHPTLFDVFPVVLKNFRREGAQIPRETWEWVLSRVKRQIPWTGCPTFETGLYRWLEQTSHRDQPPQELMERLAKMMDKDPSTRLTSQRAFEEACYQGDLELAKWIFFRYPHPHPKAYDYDMILAGVIEQGVHLEVAQWLMEEFQPSLWCMPKLTSCSFEMFQWVWFVLGEQQQQKLPYEIVCHFLVAVPRGQTEIAEFLMSLPEWEKQSKEYVNAYCDEKVTEGEAPAFVALSAWENSAYFNYNLYNKATESEKKKILTQHRHNVEWLYHHPKNRSFRDLMFRRKRLKYLLVEVTDVSFMEWITEICPNLETKTWQNDFLSKKLRDNDFEVAFWIMKQNPELVTTSPYLHQPVSRSLAGQDAYPEKFNPECLQDDFDDTVKYQLVEEDWYGVMQDFIMSKLWSPHSNITPEIHRWLVNVTVAGQEEKALTTVPFPIS